MDLTHNNNFPFNAYNVAIFSWILMILFSMNEILKETAMFVHHPRKYLTQFESYLRFVTYFSFPLISFYFNPWYWEHKEVPKMFVWQYHVNGVGLFCIWIIQLFIMGRIPRFGIYIEVYKKVARTFINFTTAFISLFIAFILAFVPFFQDHHAFGHPSVVFKVFVMMLGEIEYDGLFKNDCPENEPCPEVLFPGTSHLLVGCFILMISMVLMNVLFGMAVADIQELYKVAGVKYLIQLVHQVESIETMLGLFRHCYQLNPAIDEFVRKNHYSKKEIQDGRYVTLTHLKKTIKIEIDIEDDLKERANKHREDELDHCQQDFKQFTEKLDLVKEEIKIMKNDQKKDMNEFSNKLDLVMEQLMALKNQQLQVSESNC